MTGSALRVGIVVPRFTPFYGGVETYTAQAAGALAAQGAEVTVVTQAPRGAQLPSRDAHDGYTIERHHLPVGDVFDVPAPAAVRAAGRPGRFDVIWLHSYHTPLAWLAAEKATVPTVLTPHYHGGGHTRLRAALHRVYRPAGQRLMAASRRIVVDTEAEAGLVLQDFPRQVHRNKITVVPVPVPDPVGGRPPYPGESHVVLTVARQEPYKRTDLLIRAVVELRNRAVPARLVVVGDGSAMADCRKLVARLHGEDVVTFTGHVDDDTLKRWWASASVYATASRHEAFGIGLAQALVAGLPVVASAIPAHCEVIRHAGHRARAQVCPVDTTDPDAATQYADALARLLQSPGARGERAAQCGLPGSAEVANRLLETLTSVIE